MTRTLRELFGKAGAASRRGRAPGARLALALGLALSTTGASACLLTEHSDFPASTSSPILRRRSPVPFDRVPFASDPDCNGNGMQFEVSLAYEDVQSDLWIALVINGVRNTPSQLKTRGLVTRAPGVLCVPTQALSARACNMVEVIVSSDYNKVAFDTMLDPADPDFASVEWFVLGPASGPRPDARSTDCDALFRDGGV